MLDYGYCRLEYEAQCRQARFNEWLYSKKAALYMKFEQLYVSDQEIKDLLENWLYGENDYKEKMWLWNLDEDDMAILNDDKRIHEDLFDKAEDANRLDYEIDIYGYDD